MDASEPAGSAGPLWQVVIVNYRTPALAVQAAQRAQDALRDSGCVTVVDSHSQDESCPRLDKVSGIEVVALHTNSGFGAALNAGARNHDSPYLLCMNADVTLTPGVIRALGQKLDAMPALGVIGPRLESPDGTIQPSCRRFPTHFNLIWSRVWRTLRARAPEQWSYVLPEPIVFSLCDVVAGACFAVRRELWDALSGMDESFFLFGEDTDFCRRAKSAGWLVAYEPGVSVTHEWGASTGQDRSAAALRHAQSMSTYLAKHFPGRALANRF